ncbi:7248_t:CDS:2 [Paraglomus brasilianum]|uniref:7248_t:CDS:1 n=1 Tax=Paraglomus brasilianum TaxID=144538 RepID=A0A9N8W978_9GLOM|nr:7248_t:CDS:2 [Paraglomus brasilianum]
MEDAEKIPLEAVMFAGSFLAGSIPLFFQLSEERLRITSALGIGLLVGTSLVVIIPEGIETLYSIEFSKDTLNREISPHLAEYPNAPTPADSSDETTTNSMKRRDDLGFDADDENASLLSPPPNHSHENSSHRYVGLSLIFGFVLMFLIDQIGAPHSHVYTSEFPDPASPEHLDMSSELETPKRKLSSITIGLVIHAAADGIALGASANQPKLELIVFLAIMLHKAPSAFGLCAVLLREGLGRRQIRRRVAIFSASAPTTAILTYILLGNIGGDMGTTKALWWTAVLLLFSGGTFLYVAMHVMKDLNGSERGHTSKLPGRVVTAVVIGMFSPILLEFGHL